MDLDVERDFFAVTGGGTGSSSSSSSSSATFFSPVLLELLALALTFGVFAEDFRVLPGLALCGVFVYVAFPAKSSPESSSSRAPS